MKIRYFLKLFLLFLIGYWAIAYFFLPLFWTHYEGHPKMQNAPKKTMTFEKIPGDPLNIGLEGSEESLVKAFIAAGWRLADQKNLKTDFKITESVILDRFYASAPVSDLYLFGRKQDLSFELLVGGSPLRRHHIRLWKAGEFGRGEMLWLGSATFDRSVGLSHRTGQITHHIAANIDVERNFVIKTLQEAKCIGQISQISGSGPTLAGRNGSGDWYFTDGDITMAVLLKNE